MDRDAGVKRVREVERAEILRERDVTHILVHCDVSGRVGVRGIYLPQYLSSHDGRRIVIMPARGRPLTREESHDLTRLRMGVRVPRMSQYIPPLQRGEDEAVVEHCDGEGELSASGHDGWSRRRAR